MSIRDNMIQQVLGNPGKYSIQQLQDAMKSGSLPAYVVVPIIQDKMQQQKQMQAAMMQQPPQSTVADQIMQEAQTTQGVDALRSNLPEDYAHGGIVAFDNGGMASELGMAGDLFGAPESIYTRAGPPPLTREEAEALIAEMRKKGAVGYGEILEVMKRVPGATPQSTGGASGSWGTPAPAGKPPAAGPGAAGPGTGAVAAPAGIAGLEPSGVKRPYMPSAKQAVTEAYYGTETEPGFIARAAARDEKLEADVKKAESKVTGKAFEGYEESLRKEAEAFGADKEQAKNIAIFKAGLAIMAGTSRHALQNIGAGAMVGAEDYQKAAADIKKAQKDNERRMAEIEQARRSEAIGDRDRAIARLDKANTLAESRDSHLTNAFMNAGIKDVDRAVELYKVDLDKETKLRVAEKHKEAMLGAAQMRTEGRGELSEFQTQQLLAKARQEYPLDLARAELAKRQKLSKVPPLGADQAFDAEARKLHKMYVHELAGVPMDEDVATAGQPINYRAAGYRVLP